MQRSPADPMTTDTDPRPPDPIREAYERGEMPVQPLCPCCRSVIETDCAAVVIEEQTGRCEMEHGPLNALQQCQCHGSRADGGLCEDCYVSTK